MESKPIHREARQEGGYAKEREIQCMSVVSLVPEGAKQGAEAGGRDWSWVEGSIWTERMLTVLGNGIKEGKENAFFAEQRLYTMKAVRVLASQSRC